jgi:hypothetical protein
VWLTSSEKEQDAMLSSRRTGNIVFAMLKAQNKMCGDYTAFYIFLGGWQKVSRKGQAHDKRSPLNDSTTQDIKEQKLCRQMIICNYFLVDFPHSQSIKHHCKYISEIRLIFNSKFTICVNHLHCSYGSPVLSWFDHLDPRICERRLKIKNIGFIQVGAAKIQAIKDFWKTRKTVFGWRNIIPLSQVLFPTSATCGAAALASTLPYTPLRGDFLTALWYFSFAFLICIAHYFNK